LVGVGTLQKAYEALKKKLQAEGLFSTERKRSIPKFPARIGLITSGEAAAYGDFLRILNNRWSGVEVVHIPVTVQGQHAVREIIEAFDQFNALPSTEKPEVIVLTRGGGSLEDLHAFNDEQTARAVFQSTIPVVVGVGHERDESLCDFVADVRASTPSNAAERIVPNRADILREIGTTANRMEDVLKLSLERKTRTVDHGISKIDQIITSKLVNMRSKVDGMVRLFKAFDVQKSLDRGFSIVRKDGKIVKDANKVGLKDVIEVQLAKGRVNSLVIAKDLGK